MFVLKCYVSRWVRFKDFEDGRSQDLVFVVDGEDPFALEADK